MFVFGDPVVALHFRYDPREIRLALGEAASALGAFVSFSAKGSDEILRDCARCVCLAPGPHLRPLGPKGRRISLTHELESHSQNDPWYYLQRSLCPNKLRTHEPLYCNLVFPTEHRASPSCVTSKQKMGICVTEEKCFQKLYLSILFQNHSISPNVKRHAAVRCCPRRTAGRWTHMGGKPSRQPNAHLPVLEIRLARNCRARQRSRSHRPMVAGEGSGPGYSLPRLPKPLTSPAAAATR